ncbi:hypothetical protein IEO21_03262 [Rhodonia placenta]|uniref:Uncharacterized protein n=1 Tax=Rhodonia placenta TaxID=104341 RepID=A0A8H7P6J0_9APHY|nr:hypothetical protein IEO21_03262 [Postia placenta]
MYDADQPRTSVRGERNVDLQILQDPEIISIAERWNFEAGRGRTAPGFAARPPCVPIDATHAVVDGCGGALAVQTVFKRGLTRRRRLALARGGTRESHNNTREK